MTTSRSLGSGTALSSLSMMGVRVWLPSADAGQRLRQPMA